MGRLELSVRDALQIDRHAIGFLHHHIDLRSTEAAMLAHCNG
jgi:hypothetical protein